MRATNIEFATRCRQVLHISVSNVDSERGFSAYGDIASAKRYRLMPQNAKIRVPLYFGDGANDYDLNKED